MRFLRPTLSCGMFYLEFPQQIRKRSLPSSKQGSLYSSFEGEDIDADFEIFDDLDDIQDEDITDFITEEQTDRQVDADAYWMYSDEDL
jgi:flagellar motor switch protein FliG